MDVPSLDFISNQTVKSIITSKGKRKFDDVNNLIIDSLELNLNFNSILVLAEGWPSWAYSISGFGIDTNIFVCSMTNIFYKKYRHLFDKRIVWWDWCTLADELKSLGIDGSILFCIQGSRNFCNAQYLIILAYQTLSKLNCIFAIDFLDSQCVTMNDNEKKENQNDLLLFDTGYRQFTVSHAVCGGSTNDRRSFLVLKNGLDKN